MLYLTIASGNNCCIWSSKSLLHSSKKRLNQPLDRTSTVRVASIVFTYWAVIHDSCSLTSIASLGGILVVSCLFRPEEPLTASSISYTWLQCFKGCMHWTICKEIRVRLNTWPQSRPSPRTPIALRQQCRLTKTSTVGRGLFCICLMISDPVSEASRRCWFSFCPHSSPPQLCRLPSKIAV